MKWNDVWVTFALLFITQMSDKTQLAAITLVADQRSPVAVFIGAVIAITLVTLLGVAVGSFLNEYVPVTLLKRLAAVASILIVALMLFNKL